MKSGPLGGLRVIELAGLAPAPFAATMLADLGADVIRVDRAKPGHDVLSLPSDPLMRGRRTIGVDTKKPDGVEVVLRLAEHADVLIEGFRPGVAERMGLGPEQVHARNPRVVYGRVTGWGQDGPLAHAAGHDINYVGLAGALEPIGRAGEPPVPPLNLVADFAGVWPGPRGTNLLDGGAPFYDTYETADGKYVAVGAIETRFWGELVKVLGLEGMDPPVHLDAREWPRLRKILAEAICKHTRDELVALAEGTDSCLTPVLSPWEAAGHPHNAARGTFVDVGGVVQPAPAPRFDRTPPAAPEPPHERGADTAEVLGELGYGAEELTTLREAGVVA